ncbi:MAG: molybdopterin molybdotransferase MoeA [Cellulomonadaceae bacterium]|jgi:molybdopterin molybdotransferase|nr:molybdopterin molybdotransferase MoeA [Cellulomonadaceae bacterium]
MTASRGSNLSGSNLSASKRSVSDYAAAVRALVLPALPPRTLEADVTAPWDFPRFDNAAMDGFAVRRADLVGLCDDEGGRGASAMSYDDAAAGMTLAVSQTIGAGTQPEPLAPKTATPVMTGAPIPSGADAVVKVEDTVDGRFDVDVARFRAVPGLGDHIRRAGEDARAGETILTAGTALGPVQVGVLASLGMDVSTIIRPVRVLVVSTGTELVQGGAAGSASARPDRAGADSPSASAVADDVRGAGSPGDATTPAPAQVYSSNGAMLAAALRGVGAEVTQVTVPDDPTALRAAVSETTADLILTTGGISMGAFEVVKQALAGPNAWFGQVALQPGKPQGSGTVSGIPFVALPGNPVSAFVSFEMFVRPVLAEHAGLPPRILSAYRAAEPLTSKQGLTQIRFGTVKDGQFRQGTQGSHRLIHLAQATHLMVLPAEVTSVAAGETVHGWEIS